MDKLEKIKAKCTIVEESRQDQTYDNGISEEDILWVIADIAQSLREISQRL